MKRFKSSESKSAPAVRSPCSGRNFSSVSQKPGVAKIGKALSARWTAVPHPPVLMCLAYPRAGCERTGARDASRDKLLVATKLKRSSNFISDLLSYIYLTQQIFIPTTSLICGANARTDRQAGISQRSLEALGRCSTRKSPGLVRRGALRFSPAFWDSPGSARIRPIRPIGRIGPKRRVPFWVEWLSMSGTERLRGRERGRKGGRGIKPGSRRY
jgi:hypothetical protein